ncbi:MAG TPA: aminopeptidase P family protein [Firmicutes bacterium]|jgi:Xaa-Pro dipeptidase|nr:aminopeptidase P family protein [Bacillota bacterium]
MLLNKARLDSLLRDSNFEVLIVGKPENAIYMTNFHPMGSRTIRDRLTYVLYFKDEGITPIVLSPSIDVGHVRELSWIPEDNIVGYTEFPTGHDTGLVTDKFGYISGVLREHGLDNATIGIEASFLSSYLMEAFQTSLPKATLVDCSQILRTARAVKSPEEIRRLRLAAEATEKGCRRMIELASRGETEIRIASEAKATSMLAGAETIGFSAVGGGPRSARVHNNPRNMPVKPGEVFRFDYGALCDGYWGDLARSYVFGRKPTPEQQRIYDTVLKAQEAALEAVKPGVTAGEIHRVAVAAGRTVDPTLRREHVGHGVGLEVHEEPILRAGNDMIIEPGMVLCVEVGKYVPEVGGFQVEDTVVVTESGIEVLSSLPKTLALSS